ncbi:MAG: glycosyltransferase family 39 protein, partial [Chloroflexaceae bacterium]|nr:glycosyltransferase family 39 protein [Chloroflexaceae bacterium]
MEGLLAWRWLPWLLIGFGASIRVAQYLANRALWIDEAFLALNITRRPLDQLLFQPLDFAQAAPPGFLLLQWLAVQALGTSEFALRLVPLLASLAALPLFYMVARQLLPPVGMLVALALFALLEPLVYYASEVKQYSSDMALVLLIYVVVLGVQERGLNWRNGLALALVGALAMWCSHPVLFVLGGVGLSLALLALLARQWRQLAGLAAIGLAWAVSLAALYVISLQPIRANSVLNSFWNDRFMPLPPRSMADILWFVDAFFQPFQNPAGFQNHAAGVAIACFLIGAGALALKRSPWLLFLVTPNLLALLASGLHLYPYAYRLLLFSVPAMLLLI